MDVKRLITHFTYRIEPKPEGGFVAHASDPTLPPLEAATRQELQEKIQANINAALVTEFPQLKQPLENKDIKFSFHVEHHAGGGFSIQSTDGKELPITGGTHAEIENHFAEKLGGIVGKLLMPEFAQALANQSAGDVKVFVNRKVVFSNKTPDATSCTGEPLQLGSMPSEMDSVAQIAGPINSAITAEKSSLWPIIRFVIAALALGALTYLYRHR